MATSRFATVALNVPLLPPLTYRIAETMSPCVGDRCVVPLGRRQEVGLIVALSDQTTIDPKNRKPSYDYSMRRNRSLKYGLN